jgi:hypothetical protein
MRLRKSRISKLPNASGSRVRARSSYFLCKGWPWDTHAFCCFELLRVIRLGGLLRSRAASHNHFFYKPVITEKRGAVGLFSSISHFLYLRQILHTWRLRSICHCSDAPGRAPLIAYWTGPAELKIRFLPQVYATLIPIVLGIVVASGGEPLFNLFGFLMCLTSTSARACKSVLQVSRRALCLFVSSGS